jgi:transposase-like protein
MGKVKNKYSLEFKQQLIAEIDNNVVSLSEQARRHGLSPSLINTWRKKFSEGTLTASPDRRVRELEKEVDSLKGTIGDLYRQVEALKKMDLYVQKKKSESSLIISGRNLAASKKPAKR